MMMMDIRTQTLISSTSPKIQYKKVNVVTKLGIQDTSIQFMRSSN